jgi:hypothetical protein
LFLTEGKACCYIHHTLHLGFSNWPVTYSASITHCLSSSPLLAPWVFWQNRIFAIFSEIFPESWISAQKQVTRAILLKTALVRVSCIQNTQIRGETIEKVFEKIDTFWTYQSSPTKGGDD